MQNPTIVVDNIIDSDGIKTENGIKLYPLTIRRYCFLEKLKSPFVDKQNSDFSVENIVPTAYVMHLDPLELKKYTTKDIDKLVQDAFEWSDTLSIKDIPFILNETSKQINSLNEAAPESTSSSSETSDGSKKK